MRDRAAVTIALVLVLLLVPAGSCGDADPRSELASPTTRRAATSHPDTAGPTFPEPGPVVADPDLRLSGDWFLVFRDEFDGTAVDPLRWTDCYWWAVDGCTNLGNSELQWYLPEQRTVTDGSLVLRAQRESVTTPDGTYAYRSGMVTTGRTEDDPDAAPRFAFTYGFVEVRARVPTGAGLWPAVWLLPASHESRPEIDIMESLGNRAHVVEMHLHTIDADGERVSYGAEREDLGLASGWHTYAVDWRPEAVVWLVDGIEAWRVETNVPAEALYLLLNLAVGGEWAGPPDAGTEFPADFEVDYVRIWQPDDAAFSAVGLALEPTDE